MDPQTIIAQRIARELRDGMLANLGIGISGHGWRHGSGHRRQAGRGRPMQHTAKGQSKIVKACSLPLTSARPVDLVVTDLAVMAFPDGRATLVEIADGVTVDQVLAATEAELIVPEQVPSMAVRTDP